MCCRNPICVPREINDFDFDFDFDMALGAYMLENDDCQKSLDNLACAVLILIFLSDCEYRRA
jgi:hypothetical protein